MEIILNYELSSRAMDRTFAPLPKTYASTSTLQGKLELAPAGAFARRTEVSGLVEMTELRPGLVVQRMRVRDVEDRETRATVLPGLKIGLVVGGRSDLWLGHQAFQLGPQVSGRPGGMLVAVAEPDGYRRRAHRGQDEHKLILTLLPEWLEGQASGDAETQSRILGFSRNHLARVDWQPSARAAALAHQVVHAPAERGLIENLYLEARVIEIVAEALAAVVGAELPHAPLSVRDHRRLQDVMARLDAGEFDHCSLDDISRAVGMSASTLHRAFKAFSGKSLFDHMRGRRLDVAREAIEREGFTVSQAAALAGYGNATNFATAFRRRFGCPPSAVKSRC